MRRIILIILLINCCFSFSQNYKYVLDPKGKLSDLQTLFKTYPDNAVEFRIVKDSGKVFQITAPRYLTYKVNYTVFKTKISQITHQLYNDSTIFVFQFYYKNDTTLLTENNVFDEQKRDFKNFIKEMKRSIEKKYPNVIIFLIFENGIIFSNFNKVPSKREVFYSDKGNFFKGNLFKKSILCGSQCIMKPNGEIVVRNGEYRLDRMIDNLKPENWNQLFPN